MPLEQRLHEVLLTLSPSYQNTNCKNDVSALGAKCIWYTESKTVIKSAL
jgi:hypothetical protein